MRLRDLDARFVDRVQVKSLHRRDSDSVVGAQGLQFQCPLCAQGKDVGANGERRYVVGAHYIEVLFSNPQGVDVAPADAGATGADGSHPRWRIAGGWTLDDLTLEPSINCDIPWKDEAGMEHESVCKFHGYVRNGDAA